MVDLQEAFKASLSPFVEDPLFQSIAIFLDTESYNIMEIEEILQNVNVISDRFKTLLVANGCDLSCIPSRA